MQIAPFKLERYFAKYEFKVKYLLSPSDCESLSLVELLQWADEDTLALWQNLRLGYTESAGHPLLRAEVAALYTQVKPEHVVIAVPEEAILIAMQTLLKPGDHVVAAFPAYQSLYEIAGAIGCEVTPWSFELDGGRWRIDLDRLEGLLEDHARLLVVNFPHNPTGYLPDRDTLDAIVRIAREHDMYVFSDEMYRLLEYDSARRLPPMCDLYEKGISLSGLSKTFAVPGLRIGWLATQASSLVSLWHGFKDYTTICSSAPSEILAIIALRARKAIVARNLEIIRENLETAEEFFRAHAGQFDWLKPDAGSVAFPRWTGRTSVEELCEGLLEREGVMVVPGSIFDFPGNHFRLGLGRKNLREVLARVADYLREFDR